MSTGYTIVAGAALVAATAKTVINLITGANSPSVITEFGISFDGISSTAVPVTIELCSSTQGAAGTSTAFTPLQLRDWPPAASVSTAAINYTVEPTALVVVKHWFVSPTSGIIIQSPLGRELVGLITAAAAGKGWVLRLTAPAIVNYKAYLEFEE